MSTLRDFQRDGVQFLLSRGRVALLDELGLGKTVQSLAAVAQAEKRDPALVVCPKAVMPEWLAHIPVWALGHRALPLAIPNCPEDIAILNYAILHRHVRNIPRLSFLIVDEAHYVKNRKARRSQAVAALARKAERVFLLTATAPLHNPNEMWHLLHVLNPGHFRSYWRFFDYFVKWWHPPGTPRGAKVALGVRPERKAQYVRLLADYTLRRTAGEYVPPLHEYAVPVAHSAQERKVYRSVRRGQLTLDGKALQFPNVLAELTTLRKLATSPWVALTTSDVNGTRCSKVDTMLGKLEGWTEPFVVFTHFRRSKRLVSALLSKAGYEVSDVDHLADWRQGSTQGLVDTFYKGGVGLNLQQASLAFFLEPAKGYPSHRQSVGRFPRMGSKHERHRVLRLPAQKTVDEHFFRHLDRLGERATVIELALAVWRELNEKGV